MRSRAIRMGVLGLLTVAMPALLVEGCEGRSEDAEQHARGGSDGARAGEGGESPGVGGSGGSAGGTSGTSGDAGQGGNAGEAGNAGESGMGGNAGTGGAPVDCPTDGSECPDGCFELPIRTGCDANLVRSHICTAERYDVTTIGCGVGGDGAVVYVDAPYDSASGLNPFYEIEGFRPCTQIEVDASDCRDFTDVPASRAVRFDVTNAGTEALFFAVSAQGCAPFAVERAPDWQELILDLNRPCGSTCGFTADGYATADFVRLEPGEAHSVEWDGRAAEPADVIRVCDPSGSASGWPEHHDDRCTNGPIVPVATGRYRVALLAYPATVPFLARECGTNETCSAELDVFGVYSYPDRCDELTVGAEFDVPETGDVVVPVTLGN